jgi:hypothetical protein
VGLLLQVLQLGPSEMRQYIQFCRQYMFAGQPVVPSMEDVQRLFDGWYDAADLTASMQQQQQVLQEQQHQLPAADRPRGRLQASQQAAAPQKITPAEHHQQPGHQPPDIQLQHPNVCNYSLTVLGQNLGSNAARLAPELAAVTFVLAGYARVSAVSLVDCVRRLEKQMLAVESAVKVMEQMKSAGAASEGVG